ncbi:MAG: hypothetical protein LUC18_01075, partial [Porphyromonadaceae bacterium]|nr:hypothetical protein [Porphyromonadaceae bacterium]
MAANKKNTDGKLIPMSRLTISKMPEMDSVKASMQYAGRRAFDILMEAQYFWNQMDRFRFDRERNKRYTYGDQWSDVVCVDGKKMPEEEYIAQQGSVPLKSNLIRRLVRATLGVFRSQDKEPTCIARDRNEQKLSEIMSTILQYNMQLNRMQEVYARTMEEYLIGGLIVHRKSYGWRNGREDCWTDYVQPNNFFIDNNMRDFRGWDVTCLGEVHDVSFGQLCGQFATSPGEYRRLREIYKYAANRELVASFAEKFGYSRLENYDFLLTTDPGRCRVIEVWRKEQKPRYVCHDYLTGDIYKIDETDYTDMVLAVNERRRMEGTGQGMAEEEIPLIQARWIVDDYWYYYFLSPFGDILQEGETPYMHGSHPYVFKAYPFIDGEIHSFVADVIDQQRYVNRLITLYDWIMRASAKGVLTIPKDCIPDNMTPEDFAEQWAQFNGVIVYKPSKYGQMPRQITNNSTNIGVSELLNLQLKFFEDISGVTGALQGKAGYSGESFAHYNQQTQNATTSLLDLLESFSSFVVDCAYKDVKNIQQFYDEKRVFDISGKTVEYDPEKIQDAEFDLSIT